MTNDSADRSLTLSIIDPVPRGRNARLALHSALAATRPIPRVRHSIESWLDDLDFAQWMFVLCVTAMVLLIKRRLRGTAAALIRLFPHSGKGLPLVSGTNQGTIRPKT
jgi:hypothetical protein